MLILEHLVLLVNGLAKSRFVDEIDGCFKGSFRCFMFSFFILSLFLWRTVGIYSYRPTVLLF